MNTVHTIVQLLCVSILYKIQPMVLSIRETQCTLVDIFYEVSLAILKFFKSNDYVESTFSHGVGNYCSLFLCAIAKACFLHAFAPTCISYKY